MLCLAGPVAKVRSAPQQDDATSFFHLVYHGVAENLAESKLDLDADCSCHEIDDLDADALREDLLLPGSNAVHPPTQNQYMQEKIPEELIFCANACGACIRTRAIQEILFLRSYF